MDKTEFGRGLSRRDFLSLAATGAAVGFAAVSFPAVSAHSATRFIARAGAWNAFARGAIDIDPPPGDAFADPPVLENLGRRPGLVEVELDVRLSRVKVASTTAGLYTYNGAFPPETIRVRRGDLLRLRLKNSLPATSDKNVLGATRNITNLHTHGWHVSPSGNSDNIWHTIAPGSDFVFEYDTSAQEAGTLGYYHPHYHHLVAEQMWGGLSGGALVVEDEDATLAGIETHVMVIKDISLAGDEPTPYSPRDFFDGKEGGIVLVNGQVNPVITTRPGRLQRWRVLNSCTARYLKLSLEGHKLHVIGADGGLLDKPYPVRDILMTPGERVDMLVVPNSKAGVYRLFSLPYDRRYNRAEKVTLATLECSGTRVREQLPKTINRHAARLRVDTSRLPVHKIYFMMANGRGLVNGRDFDTDPCVITSRTGTYEVWEIYNISPMDHPFHQHTNAAQVLEINGGDAGYASFYSQVSAWKDTINIPFCGSVRMLVPVNDFTGRALMHCHILEHEDIGMMSVWEMV